MKLLRLVFLVFIISIIFSSASCVEANESFFSDSEIEIAKNNLSDFIRKIPNNRGQYKTMERVLNTIGKNDMIMLIEPKFTIEELDHLSKNRELFLLIEMLDIYSYNEERKRPFSDWYFNKLVSITKENPSQYLDKILTLVTNAEGVYAEWFSDPILDILEKNVSDFNSAVENLENKSRLCGIFATGDINRAINIINKNIENGQFDQLEKIKKCLEGIRKQK